MYDSFGRFRKACRGSQPGSRKARDCDAVLVEVNIAREESKFGIYEEDTLAFIEKISALPNIRVEGLMSNCPFVENAEENRIFFRKLRNLYVDIKSKNIDNVTMCNLSMGMTGDYQVAIEEGHDGTGWNRIFGERKL